MGNVKITEYPEITTPADDDWIEIVNAAASKKVKKSNLFGVLTAYTPTVTAGSGTFTTVSATGRFRAIGKTCFFIIQVVITTNGTAATSVQATLPLTALIGLPVRVSGGLNGTDAVLGGYIASAGTAVGVKKYDGTYPGGDGITFQVSGVYETA